MIGIAHDMPAENETVVPVLIDQDWDLGRDRSAIAGADQGGERMLLDKIKDHALIRFLKIRQVIHANCLAEEPTKGQWSCLNGAIWPIRLFLAVKDSGFGTRLQLQGGFWHCPLFLNGYNYPCQPVLGAFSNEKR